MKPIQLRTNYPADFDPEEKELLVQARLHAGERRTHDYPGSEPHIEMLTVCDLVTGSQTDFYELPPWVQDELRTRMEEEMRERA
jgi:hypothetical protein